MLRRFLSGLFFGSAIAAAQPGIATAASPAPQRDCAECPELVAIPSGEFVMGAAAGEEEREALREEFRGRSGPQRRVTIAAFHAGRYEVTRGEFRAFAQATQRRIAGCFVWLAGDYRLNPARDWENTGFAQDDRHPVVCVSWEDATAYAAWLSARTGRRYRLLTEAEWEYAARAGTATARYWGDDPGATCVHANGADLDTAARVPEADNWPGVLCRDGHPWTAPVGQYRPNAFGLHDMLGNAAEWTADCWNPAYRGAPRDGTAWAAGDCSMRPVRGGAWDEGPLSLRSAYRVGSPVVIRVQGRGFRVARDP